MEDEDKKFQLPEIIILILLAIFTDIAMSAAVLAIAIPGFGIVFFGLALAICILIWAAMLIWFTIKLGFGTPAIIITVAGILKMIGLPSMILGVGIGVYLANHPKVAAVAAVATGKPGATVAKEGMAGAEAATAEIKAGEKAAAGRIPPKPEIEAGAPAPEGKLPIEKQGGAYERLEGPEFEERGETREEELEEARELGRKYEERPMEELERKYIKGEEVLVPEKERNEGDVALEGNNVIIKK